MSMIEQVATALRDGLANRCILDKTDSIDLAKLAIEAMLNPTPEMMEAASFSLGCTYRSEYQEAIKYALKESVTK